MLGTFFGERGLRLSENKTKIVNVRDGFDWLSKYYIKIHNEIRVIPSEKAVKNFEQDLEDFILNPEKKWNQRSLIRDLNAKLYGWATYHRVEESEEIFKHIDVRVNALLLKLMQQIYPKQTLKQLRDKYWYKLSDGTYVYALVSNKDYYVTNLADIPIVRQRRMDFKKNIFLDPDYFEEKEINSKINKNSDDYKKIWKRQEGKCYFCGKPIKFDEPRCLVQKRLSNNNAVTNLAYVHEYCKNDELYYIDTDIMHLNNSSLKQIINDIENVKNKFTKKISKSNKFKLLEEYFNNQTKPVFCIKFKDIEEILKFRLCDSAYKYESYWRAKNSFTESWTNQNYELQRIYLKEKKVTFHRIGKKAVKLNIPQVLLGKNLPEPCKM